MKNLILRAITGAVYVALICYSVLAGGWNYIIFFALITLLALHEFYNLCNSSNGGENITTLVIDIVGGIILCIGLGCVNMSLLSPFTTAVLGGTFFTVYLLFDCSPCNATLQSGKLSADKTGLFLYGTDVYSIARGYHVYVLYIPRR